MTGPTNSLLLLLKHSRNRCDVSVLLPGRGLFSEELASERIPFFSFSSLTKWSIPAITRLIRRERFALVYGNNHSSSSRNAFIAAKLTRIPFVCHIREMGREGDWRKMGYLRFAHAAIAVSKACAASVARFVPDDRVHVVYNGVQISADPLSRPAARTHSLAQTGLASEDVVIISMGHICPRKGQSYAVEAMANVVKQMPSARLLLVGSLDRDAAYVKKIRTQIRTMKLEEHVFLMGFQRDIEHHLRGADVFLHTALTDPHPRSVIEGMAANLPVVAFAADGVEETVIDNQTGYLVPRGDTSGLTNAILQLATDSQLRTEFGGNGRRRVEAYFSAKGTASRITQIIGELL